MGARQVGKTWLMREFGRLHYKKVAYVSFYGNSPTAKVFEEESDVKKFLAALNIASGVTITPHDTLIVLDEIQNAPKAFESLKLFCEEAPEYHLMVAGSLLGVAVHEGVSFPVGKVDTLQLHPMTFREYLHAVGEERLSETLGGDCALADAFAERCVRHLKNYLFVGGMPEAVDVFRKNNDYRGARTVQKNIVRQYRGDFGKHVGPRELPKINMVWDAIPTQLAKENKKFFFGRIKPGARSAEFENAVQWLSDAGLVHKVHRANEPRIPLAAYRDFSAYKLFALDVGLLGAMANLDPKALLEGDRLFVEFKGALAEQYVLQQIVGETELEPFYFGTDKATFEQDFLLQIGMDAVPVEVKSSTNVRSQSLKSFCDKYRPGRAVRFSLRPYADQGWMVNIPLYSVCTLEGGSTSPRGLATGP
ncbi:MAG: ATP-binding protein [Fibrobacterales bacterium]|nr:ATP-binding protein [Fibrobacterales bacterium]